MASLTKAEEHMLQEFADRLLKSLDSCLFFIKEDNLKGKSCKVVKNFETGKTLFLFDSGMSVECTLLSNGGVFFFFNKEEQDFTINCLTRWLILNDIGYMRRP